MALHGLGLDLARNLKKVPGGYTNLLEFDDGDRSSFDPFCELVYGDKQVGVASGCLFERPNQIEPQTMKGHVMGMIWSA